MHENKTIDVTVGVDSTGLYEYAFYRMYERVRERKEQFSAALTAERGMAKRILEIEDPETEQYETIVKLSSNMLLVETEDLLMRLLAFNGVGYIPFGKDEKNKLNMPFYRIEENRKIAYVFSHRILPRADWDRIRDEYGLDGIKAVAIVEYGEASGSRNLIVSEEARRNGGCVEYISLQDFFALIPGDEYKVYMEYVTQYLQNVRKLIGYRTIVVPSESSLQQLKANVEVELRDMGFDSLLRREGLREDQIRIIAHNFYERGLYKALFGTMPFAESFISSEWYYQSHIASSVLEQTAIIAGYLKSVEQLLYAIIQLSIGTKKTIKKKGTGKVEYIEYCVTNTQDVDFSLGSMIGYIRHYSELWDVNNYAKNRIANKLDIFRDQYRNDHFHKDNIHSKEEIQEIRNYVMLMMYLLLGGMKIEDSCKGMLGIQQSLCDSSKKKGLEYQALEKWLDRTLGGDVLLPPDSNIFFRVESRGTEQWRLVFLTVKGFPNQDIPEGMEWPYCDDDLRWDRMEEDDDVQEVVRMVKEMLMRYMSEGRFSNNLMDYSSVSVGSFWDHEELHHTAHDY